MAERDDDGKLPLDLIPASTITELAKVLQFGAKKYDPNQWRKGFLWSRVIASLMRHLTSFLSGEDCDPESGLLHLSHALANLSFLIEFITTHPELDDRSKKPQKKIGLDIDDVCADFLGAYKERFGIIQDVHSWHFDPEMPERMQMLKKDKEFWINLKPLFDPKDLKFEPHCYVSARGIPEEWTIEWLHKNGFPIKPVIHVGFQNSKAEAVKIAGCQWFVDDGYHNYIEINQQEGVCCFLLTTTQNQKYKEGILRIATIHDLPN